MRNGFWHQPPIFNFTSMSTGVLESGIAKTPDLVPQSSRKILFSPSRFYPAIKRLLKNVTVKSILEARHEEQRLTRFLG